MAKVSALEELFPGLAGALIPETGSCDRQGGKNLPKPFRANFLLTLPKCGVPNSRALGLQFEDLKKSDHSAARALRAQGDIAEIIHQRHGASLWRVLCAGLLKENPMNLVTLAQAIAWVCTREHEVMQAIAVEPAEMQLLVAKQQWLTEHSVAPWRFTLEGDGKPGATKMIERAAFASFHEAMTGLTLAIWNGFLPLHIAKDGEYFPLTGVELGGLELRIMDESAGLIGLWNTKSQQFLYANPKFMLKDLERLWPGPMVPATIAMTKTILDALMAATENSSLKKEDALALMQKLTGFGRRRFEAAWQLLPKERKVGRGKRGPNRKAA